MIQNFPNPFNGAGVRTYLALKNAGDMDNLGITQKVRLGESVWNRLNPTAYDPLTSLLLCSYETALKEDEFAAVQLIERRDDFNEMSDKVSDLL